MTKRNRRTPEQIVADREAKLAAAKAKLAKNQAQNRDDLAPLLAMQDAINGEIATVRRGFSNGPQSFESRLESHRLWIAEIEAAKEYSQHVLDNLTSLRDSANEAVQDLLAKVVDNPDKDYHDEVSAVLDRLDASLEDDQLVLDNLPPEVDEAQDSFLQAQMDRQSFTESKKARKRDSEDSEQASEAS